ncbi:MAG: hypothetical protein ACLR56_01850 [Oscillospiraceae bacterium]
MNYNAKNSLLLQLLKLFGAYIVSQLLIVFIFAAAVSGDEIPENTICLWLLLQYCWLLRLIW